jgi:hypothetical protein
MKQRFSVMLPFVFALALSLWTAASFAAQPDRADLQTSASGGQEQGFLAVELTKTLDAKNLKPGAEVKAVVSQRKNGMSLPLGAKVIGHVTEARARSKGDAQSSLAIVFDKIVPQGTGSAAPIRGTLRAVAPNPSPGINTGGTMGSADLKEGAVKGVMTSQSGNAAPLLNKNSSGVLGIKDLQMSSDGKLTSSGKDVKLEQGTQLLLTVKLQ